MKPPFFQCQSKLCAIALSRPSIPHLAALSALFGIVLIFTCVPWFLRGALRPPDMGLPLTVAF
jgi:hypothetical protein